MSLNVKRSYSGCIRIRRKCCKALLRLCVKYTFKTLFFRRFTTRINCSNYSCSLLRVSKLTCTSTTCTVWREITTNAAPDLVVAQMLENFPVVGVKLGSHQEEVAFLFCKNSKVDLFLFFFTVAISFNTPNNCRNLGFLILVLNWMGFLCRVFLRHWRKTWKIWKNFIFVYKWVFSFLFFGFRSEFRIYLAFPFLFCFQCIFYVKFSCET